MTLQTPQIRVWPFRKAPARLQAMFREGTAMDWVASVPGPLAAITESHFQRLRQLHPVSSVEMSDGSVVYWGTPRESITRIAERYAQHDGIASVDRERRMGTRVPMDCPIRYETGSAAHKKTGQGRTVDMSHSGVFFTTESLLRKNTRVTLHIAWPVRLNGDESVELFANGKVVRAQESNAAVQYDHISFRLAT